MNVNSAPAILPNPFNIEPRTQGSAAEMADFDEQLASVLGESLKKLGVSPGEVNITIRRGAEAGAARQIFITYNAGSADSPSSPPSAPVAAALTPTETEWCSYDGPRDRRDTIAAGGGKVLASGAPEIEINEHPAENQYGYSGPAAFNPYFTTPSNPLRPGYVLGYSNWFRDATVFGGITGPMPANRAFFATAEGAEEALRLVRQYEPQAQLVEVPWGGGPFSASNTMLYVELPGNRLMNAGLVLHGYYNGGNGVSVESDVLLHNAFRAV